jgi:hypothetical protein
VECLGGVGVLGAVGVELDEDYSAVVASHDVSLHDLASSITVLKPCANVRCSIELARRWVGLVYAAGQARNTYELM